MKRELKIVRIKDSKVIRRDLVRILSNEEREVKRNKTNEGN
ncbi:hypothetical protein [Clostridium tagluense]|nr:hypothetical protein [Clostridium tagluense]